MLVDVNSSLCEGLKLVDTLTDVPGCGVYEKQAVGCICSGAEAKQ